jgi:hypothetical protein
MMNKYWFGGAKTGNQCTHKLQFFLLLQLALQGIWTIQV